VGSGVVGMSVGPSGSGGPLGAGPL
jgi:hypothetical protein